MIAPAPKMARFNLDKGPSHNFDLEKKKPRRFDLEKDNDDEAPAPAPTPTQVSTPTPSPKPAPMPTPSVSEPEPAPRKSFWWMLAVVLIALVAAFFAFRSCGNGEAAEPVAEEPAQQEEPAVVEEPQAEEVAVEAEETVVEAPQQEPAAEAPATPPTTAATAPTSVSSDIEAEAMKVIRGDYGVGLERIDRLGPNYQAIQERVNEILAEYY